MSTVATIPATVASNKEAFRSAIGVLWGAECPSYENHSPKTGQWFSFSVRHPETGWAVLATTRTYAELVAHMAKVSAMGILPVGTLISASRCYGYCEYDCSHHAQTFLLSQVGRELCLISSDPPERD